MNCGLLPRQNSRETGLHRRRGTGGDQCEIIGRQFQHLGDAFSGGNLQIRNADEVLARKVHYRLNFGAHQGAAENVMVPWPLITVVTPSSS